jgi:mannose-6-phosphate isomerase
MDPTRIRVLRNPIRNYAWGSHTAISELLGLPSPTAEPQAELWMGAHPSAPSRVVVDDADVPLDRWIARDPAGVLGAAVAERFDAKLPFLFKVLAAGQPLSIQTHPSLEQARVGFARENAAGIPLDAPHRCYRDANHKPELICALTPFCALDRFRPVKEILGAFDSLDLSELESLLDALRFSPDRSGLETFFRALMTLDSEARERLVDRAVHAAAVRASEPAHEWIVRLAESHPGDVGVLAPLLLNLVELQPGEAMYLPPGEIHSYLGGVGIELMANSDNVLRGGLTQRHVDVAELLDLLNFREGEPEHLLPHGVVPGEGRYETPADEFALSILHVTKRLPYRSRPGRGVEILLCTEGDVRVVNEGSGQGADLGQGTSVIVPAAVAGYRLEGEGTVYRAHVGAGRFR